jgi:HK97 family phage portal protein
VTDIGGLQSLAEWLGLTVDELDVKGAKSLKEITVFTCIRILSETIGKLPIKIYNDKGKATDHPLYPLLKLRPNPYMSAYIMKLATEVQRNVYGNAYWWMDISRRYNIKGLYLLDSTKMEIYVDDVGLISSKTKVWYVYTDKTGVKHKIDSDEIMHFKGLSLDGITGLSTIEMLKMQVETNKAEGQFLNNSLKNGMTTSGIVQYVGDLDEKKKETFRKNFESMSSGLKNVNRVSLLPIGYQYQPIALKMTDAQFLENTKLSIQQLTAAFGIKPHQVNQLEKASYASQSEANREFYVDTLMATLTQYEQEIDYKGFTEAEITDEGYYTKFNADVILRGDPKARFTAYAQAVQNGIKTPNEIRALEEDEPLPGGDRLFMNGNMVPIEEAGAAYRKKGGE